MKKSVSKIYTALILVLLFAPIAILLVFSFNAGKSLSVFSGFSLYWYRELWNDAESLNALRNTVILALSAAAVSTVMGTAAAVGMDKLRNKYLRSAMDAVTNIPMINPDIITGISLMLMFVFVGQLFGASTSLNFWTMLVAHITFCLPYVILQVLPKLKQMDRALPEAAMDLGCTPFRAFWKVELPEIMPGVVTGLIMAFTLSLDDFVISYFTSGNGFQTLPIRIYNMTKKTVTPKMYALATLIFFAILLLLILKNIIDTGDSSAGSDASPRKKPAAAETAPATRNSYSEIRRRRRILYASGAALVVLSVVIIVACSHAPVRVLNIYNWGEYISDGSDGSLDTIQAFEEWYEETYGEKVRVNYSTYASNEDMYAKLSSGAVSYDVVIPSDYMIARMREEGMLLPLDFDNIPNYSSIGEAFRGLYYDPDNLYTVPYTYSFVGIIYNANVVDEADAQGWDLLWNEKYAGSILQFNNSRDAFATAQYKLGLDVNSSDHALWDQALAELVEQAPLVKSYVMDEIYNMMESGEAAVAAYYCGDYFTMLDAQADNVDLRCYVPDPTNYFVDAMCIPNCCSDKELAEIFINYMLSPEPAIANAEYIYYASPNSAVTSDPGYVEDMGEEAMAILYPDTADFSQLFNAYAYRNLDADMLSYLNSLWETLKIS